MVVKQDQLNLIARVGLEEIYLWFLLFANNHSSLFYYFVQHCSILGPRVPQNKYETESENALWNWFVKYLQDNKVCIEGIELPEEEKALS